jgi:hypothetical protein
MKREYIRKNGYSLDFEGPLDDIIDMLLKAKEEGWNGIDVKYYGGEYREYIIYQSRLETDEEYSIRKKELKKVKKEPKRNDVKNMND